jgi:hypothetical protein
VGDITLRLDILISYGAFRDNVKTKIGKNLLFHRERECQKMEMFYPICEMKSDKSDFIKRPLGALFENRFVRN